MVRCRFIIHNIVCLSVVCIPDYYDAVTVDVLMKLLYTRGPSKGGQFILNFKVSYTLTSREYAC